MCEDVEEEEEEEEKKNKQKEKKRKKMIYVVLHFQISNHLMQYIPHNIHTSMFTTFKSSALSISTAVT